MCITGYYILDSLDLSHYDVYRYILNFLIYKFQFSFNAF